MHCTVCAHSLSRLKNASIQKCIGLHFVLCSTKTSEKCSHSECIGLHYILCRTKKVGPSCSGTRFNRLTFVRMSMKSRDTGLRVGGVTLFCLSIGHRYGTFNITLPPSSPRRGCSPLVHRILAMILLEGSGEVGGHFELCPLPT